MASFTTEKALSPGLYLVATPIGAARDITLRALDTLATADILLAEDTRTLRRLMELHSIPLGGRPLWSYHDHNGPAVRPRIIAALADGKSVAYASDAGTPLVADPGFVLAREAIAAGQNVTSAPGPSALLAALAVAGLPTDRFLFAGFLPPASGARKAALRELAEVPATLVFFESPRRCSSTVREMCDILGEGRPAALCRELTKKFEDVIRGSLGELSARLADGEAIRGEVVLLVDRSRAEVGPDTVEAALRTALATMRVKDAARDVADRLGVGRRDVYQMALKLEKDQ